MKTGNRNQKQKSETEIRNENRKQKQETENRKRDHADIPKRGQQSMDLTEIRRKLDKIDTQMAALYEERIGLCADVAKYKAENNRPVLDREREQEKLKMIGRNASNDFNARALEELYRQIMTISRRYQYMLEKGLPRNKEGEPEDKKEKFPEKAGGEKAEQAEGKKAVPSGVRKRKAAQVQSFSGFKAVKELPEAHRVVYQGLEGSYSQMAALAFFGTGKGTDGQEDRQTGKHPGIRFKHVEQFEDAVSEIENGKADYCVIPIDNSTAGAVTDTYDLLMRHRVFVAGEYFQPVKHALLSVPDAELKDIQTVYSHPQGFLQCEKYLNRHRTWQRISVSNTAVAASLVAKEQDRSKAAIASTLSGKLYGLKVLKEEINGSSGNTTRFVVLSARKEFPENAKKISLIFELPHKSGSLYNALGNFIFNDINMLKIESRPIPEKPFEYRFFADIEGNLKDPAVINAITGIRAEAEKLRILGNY